MVFFICRGVFATPEGAQYNTSSGSNTRDRSDAPYFRIETSAVVFFPVGAWREHPYQDVISEANELNQFGTSGGATVEVGVQALSWLGVTMGFTGTGLATRQWEEYSADHGSEIRARASLWRIQLMTHWDMVPHPRGALEARFGMALLFGEGEEEFLDTEESYEYTMFEPTGALVVGLAGGYAVTSWLDVTFGFDVTLGMGGIQYATGDNRNILGLALSAGLRFAAGRRFATNGGSR